MFSIVVGYKYTICGCTLQWGILPILIRCRSKIWMNFNFFFIHMGEAFLGVGVQSWSWRAKPSATADDLLFGGQTPR